MKKHNRKFIVPIYTVFKRQKLKNFNNQYIMHRTAMCNVLKYFLKNIYDFQALAFSQII